MMYKYNGYVPTTACIPWDGWIEETANIIGDVHLGSKVNIWFGAIVRGDTGKVRIGHYSNVQAYSILDMGCADRLDVGQYVSIEHHVTLRGCKVGDYTLIGMHSIVSEHAVVGSYCVVEANTVIEENQIIPDYSVVAGVPAKVISNVTEKDVQKIKHKAYASFELIENYRELEPYWFNDNE
ncbi:hypothetical protein P256_02018 [Acinetobacter nectaris CIP 110549]|uniref:Carnitine operon protein CaiE n=1 Tax=Acinetobacter nectaris CIP 110549 TaxID=1392540 RepID=V2URV7_9GAMM|nr:gamma carbonic anhydrase family protein [Acinetobacter nectaris]ESK38094.1 hypothetical protein P256_02018 [Acinetobacter nectaris CIP 110549]